MNIPKIIVGNNSVRYPKSISEMNFDQLNQLAFGGMVGWARWFLQGYFFFHYIKKIQIDRPKVLLDFKVH